MLLAMHDFTLDRLASPLGQMLIVCDSRGRLRALDWSDFEARMLRLLRLHYGEGGFQLREAQAPVHVRQAIERYFGGALHALDALETDTGGTAFQREVWAALRQIPPGATESYGQLALRLGRPKAVRAVGLANGANPIGVVVPCHRVIGADRSLTGYGGGLARKRWLLGHEGASL